MPNGSFVSNSGPPRHINVKLFNIVPNGSFVSNSRLPRRINVRLFNIVPNGSFFFNSRLPRYNNVRLFSNVRKKEKKKEEELTASYQDRSRSDYSITFIAALLSVTAGCQLDSSTSDCSATFVSNSKLPRQINARLFNSGMSDVSTLSGISGLSFDSPFLSPLLLFCLLLLLFLS